MQRETIVHELIHCHTHEMVRLFKTTVNNELGRLAADALDFSIEQMHELCVDGIASAWARTLPMIDWLDNSPIYHEHEEQPDDSETPARRDAVILT